MPKTNRFIEGLKESAHAYMKNDSVRMERQFDEDATVTENGVVRWKSNDSVPPNEILIYWNHLGKPFDYQASVQISEKEDHEFMQTYKKRMANHVYSEEQLHEMENAFGKGATVVDVFSGKRTTL